MKRSDSRVLTTHAGSLPRPEALNALHVRRSRGEAVDPGELARLARAATEAVVARQLEAGIDVGNDGEQARGSFFTHVAERMTGFGGASQRPLMRDLAAAGKPTEEHTIRRQAERFFDEAKKQVMTEVKK